MMLETLQYLLYRNRFRINFYHFNIYTINTVIVAFVFTLVTISNLSMAVNNTSFPLMSNLRSTNGIFVGREEFLSDMDNFLFREKKSHALVISGSPGAGKTQVISRCAELHKSNYEIIWWFDVNKNLNEQYREFARKWNKLVNKHYKDTSEQVFLQISLDPNNAYDIKEEVHDRLRSTKLNWLIILDNVKDSIITLKGMPIHNNRGYGHIIISTQNSAYHSNVMHLDKLTRDESIKLLLKITGEYGEENRNKAETLAETLKDYPLAISRAGSFIAAYPAIDIGEYNQLFLTKREKLWETENKLRAERAEFDSYKNTVFTSLSVIINEVKKESKLAYELLIISSFLDNENIPETVLLQYIKNKYQKEPTDIEYNKALSILMKYSLLSSNHQNDKYKNDFIHKEKSLLLTHELIQIVTQDLLKPKERKYYLIEAVNAINSLLPKNIYLLTNFLSQSSYFIPHIDSLLKNAEDAKLYDNEIILLGIRLLEYHLTVMRHDIDAEALINKLKKFEKKIPDLDDFVKMRLKVMRSTYLAWVKIDYQASLREILLAYELMCKLDNIFPEDQLMIYTLLARMYNFIDDDASTIKYSNLGMQVIEKASKTADLFGYKQDFFISSAKIAIDNGNYNQALNFYNLSEIDNNLNLQNKDSRENKQNEILPSNLSVYLLSVDIFLSIGKLDQAKKKLKILKKITDKLSSGNFYKISVESYDNYAEALLGADLKQAIHKALANQVRLKRLFGEKSYYKNRYASISHKFLGELYEMDGDLIKAKQEYSIALEILVNVYSDSTCASTDKLSDIYNKLAVINVKLKLPFEALKYFILHQQIFGLQHPRSIRLSNYFIDNKVNVGF